MAHEPFIPARPNEALEGYGIVLLNHAGSTQRQDSGRDADDLSRQLGVPALAVDRPGTATWRRDPELAERLSTPSGLVVEMACLGDEINEVLAEAGVDRTLVMGRSAGGLGTLALTTSAVIETQVAVYAAEPVGCRRQTIAEGRQWYSEYGTIQDHLQATVADLVLPQSPGLGLAASLSRLVSMGPDNLIDRYHNAAIWASDAALRYMYEIAATQPGIDMTVDFAHDSMMVTPSQLDDITSMLPQIRDGIHIEAVPRTTHASFDNRGFMAERVQLVFDRLLAQS